MWRVAVAVAALYAYYRLASEAPTVTLAEGLAKLRARRADDALPDLTPYENVSPVHVFRARAAARAFDERLKATFEPEAADKPAELVRRLFAERARALEALHELRMRLPNDLDMERELAAVTERADRAMLERIEDARQRCGAPLVHPGAVGSAWYGAWYRAANDAVE